MNSNVLFVYLGVAKGIKIQINEFKINVNNAIILFNKSILNSHAS
jgi:hypothetical protein